MIPKEKKSSTETFPNVLKISIKCVVIIILPGTFSLDLKLVYKGPYQESNITCCKLYFLKVDQAKKQSNI